MAAAASGEQEDLAGSVGQAPLALQALIVLIVPRSTAYRSLNVNTLGGLERALSGQCLLQVPAAKSSVKAWRLSKYVSTYSAFT